MKFIRFLIVIALILVIIIANVEGVLLLKHMPSLPNVFSKLDLLIVITSILIADISGFLMFLIMKRD